MPKRCGAHRQVSHYNRLHKGLGGGFFVFWVGVMMVLVGFDIIHVNR